MLKTVVDNCCVHEIYACLSAEIYLFVCMLVLKFIFLLYKNDICFVLVVQLV